VTQRLGLIVTDASPLITLGAAGALSCLLMPGAPVLVPDMVCAEITRDMTRLGAVEVVDWLRASRGQVQIVPTTVHAEYEALRAANPQIRSRDRGERAAVEVLDYEIARDPTLHALLLLEDSDIRSRSFVRTLPERVAAISTGDFLRALEAENRIQSADHILDEAAARGRNIEQQRIAGDDAAARERLRGHLTGRTEPQPPEPDSDRSR
jgi:hypothetical protein